MNIQEFNDRQKIIKEVIDVQIVCDALSIIYKHFGDPLKDQNENLVHGVEALQTYCMSKPIMKEISDLGMDYSEFL